MSVEDNQAEWARVNANAAKRDAALVHDARILTSSATWHVGEEIRLRRDMGGGWWRVIEVLPPKDGFQRAAAIKIAPELYENSDD